MVAAFARGQIGPLEQAKDLKFAFQFHVAHDVFIQEILHHEDKLAAKRAELFGQPRKRLARERLDIVERGRFCFGPVQAFSCHACEYN